MPQVELVMPKMGESIMEATILNWVKQEGDSVEADETVLEIATDKVDSEVPSPVSGVLTKILYQPNDVVEIGKPIAIISTNEAVDEDIPVVDTASTATSSSEHKNGKAPQKETTSAPATVESPQPVASTSSASTSNRFYSPLVRNIAKEEGIPIDELDQIDGSGMNGRVTKHDILAYLENRQDKPVPATAVQKAKISRSTPQASNGQGTASSMEGEVEIIEMDRMRRLIADHMVKSKHTSPHVTSFVEADVTHMVQWRNSVKKDFQQKYQEKITFTPLFVEAVVKAIRDFPMVNISVDGNKIIRKKAINVGMATALPSGNLIVPVIKNADELSLLGLTKRVNALANNARNNKLKPEDIQDGTFTLTNVGTFGNVMGTPIINQPQVAIMATGAIRKKPAVVETEYGDVIAIRHMMFLSLSYDHRVVDGFLGGSFLKRVADYMEGFDRNRTI